jgi:hypothetical protein
LKRCRPRCQSIGVRFWRKSKSNKRSLDLFFLCVVVKVHRGNVIVWVRKLSWLKSKETPVNLTQLPLRPVCITTACGCCEKPRWTCWPSRVRCNLTSAIIKISSNTCFINSMDLPLFFTKWKNEMRK